MKIIGIIPSRYASTRLPGKPLLDIEGTSLIQRVYEQCKKSALLSDVVVATDDKRIVQEVQSFEGRVYMTSSAHPSGTDRCAEVMELLDEEVDAVVNIQGDEPFIRPEQIDQLCRLLMQSEVELATLVKRFPEGSDVADPNTVKVVMDAEQNALYFSRSVIPFDRTGDRRSSYYQHIGIYAYRADTLRRIVKLDRGNLEMVESLEQLRWLENGYSVRACETDFQSVGVDTPEDLERARRFARTNE